MTKKDNGKNWWFDLTDEEIWLEHEFERMFENMLRAEHKDIENFKLPKIHG